jgi:TolB-like protein/class 3 adenylate cyclase
LERKLTAILCADVYGYSRLTGENEEATHRTLKSYRKLIDALIDQHHGRFVHSAGDSVLAEFVSVVNAVQCAVEIQTALKVENARLPVERLMEFRIGINLGDVIVDGVEIYGDGVNVAARLESLADPGAIFISGSVREQLGNKLPLGYADLGERSVKNIAHPVRVFRVLLDGAAMPPRATRRIPRRYLQRGVLSLTGLAIAIATIVLVQHLSLKPQTTHASIPLSEKPALPQPSIPSIAVLPFTNLSGDPQQEYFSDGITDELITKLSRLLNLLVIARTSSITYKNTPAKVQEIGRELGVKYLIEGSVRKSSDQVRISTQLVEAPTGTELWAAHFDRPLTDIFAVQDDIVQKIVSTLNLQVSLSERGVRSRQTTDNLEAYDDVLRGLAYSWRETKDDDAKAIEFYQKAIELDPNYADAYVLLSGALFNDWSWQWSQDPDAVEHSFEFAQKALALDDSDPTAHVILGRILLEQGQLDAAVAETDRGIALNPNEAGNYFCLSSGNSDWAADTLNWSGKPTEAIDISEKAMRRDPRNSDFHLLPIGVAYYILGRPAEAVPLLRRFIDSYPGFVGARVILTASDVELGRTQEAHLEATNLMRMSPDFSLEGGLFKGANQPVRLISDLRKAGLK